MSEGPSKSTNPGHRSQIPIYMEENNRELHVTIAREAAQRGLLRNTEFYANTTMSGILTTAVPVQVTSGHSPQGVPASGTMTEALNRATRSYRMQHKLESRFQRIIRQRWTWLVAALVVSLIAAALFFALFVPMFYKNQEQRELHPISEHAASGSDDRPVKPAVLKPRPRPPTVVPIRVNGTCNLSDADFDLYILIDNTMAINGRGFEMIKDGVITVLLPLLSRRGANRTPKSENTHVSIMAMNKHPHVLLPLTPLHHARSRIEQSVKFMRHSNQRGLRLGLALKETGAMIADFDRPKTTNVVLSIVGQRSSDDAIEGSTVIKSSASNVLAVVTIDATNGALGQLASHKEKTSANIQADTVTKRQLKQTFTNILCNAIEMTDNN